MKTFTITSTVLALAVTAATAVRAADADTPRTRAEVIAELNEARASGWLTAHVAEDSGSAYLSRQLWTSRRTRAETLADLKAARASGLYAALNDEIGVEPPAAVRTPAPLRYAGPSVGGAGPDGSGVHDTVVAHQA